MNNKKIINEVIEKIRKNKIKTQQELNKIKSDIAKKYKLKKTPTNIEIICNLPNEKISKFKKLLITKPTRTMSGVAVCAIMTKPMPCPHVKKGLGPCIYCPGGPKSFFGNVPQSYTGKEPATLRAIRNNYDPYLQVMNRLEQYILLNQDFTKIELIVMGGTFPSFPKKYRNYFITNAFKAMNDFSDLFFIKNKFDFLEFKKFFELPANVKNKERTERIQKKLLILKNKNKKNIESEQKRNESNKVRCVGLTIETRPDYGMLKEGNEMLRLGATRIELGIQSVYEDTLKKINRGHSVFDAISSTRILKDLGFKINYHIMPGLPGVTKNQDLMALKQLFEYPEFRPDMLKIYPCMVLKGTKLYELYKKKKFKPLTTEQAAELISEFKKYVPEYCRIMRVQRDIPSYLAEAGVKRTNLRQYINKLLEEKNIKCRCIRCREPRGKEINLKNIKLKIVRYNASKGIEYFISAEDIKNDIIIGYCRLRFPSQCLRKEITKNSALIRELHVFGPAVSVGKKGELQHKGIGKILLKKAEEIAKENNKNKIIVISGVGVREYYRKLGYKKEGVYMVKKL